MFWSKHRGVIKRVAICAAVLVLVAGGAAFGYHDMQEAKAQREEDYQNGIAAIAFEEYEQERISEEAERQREKEMRKILADEIPYEGMSEDYIDLTAVGKHGKYSTSDFKISGRTIYEHKYVWYSSNGKDVPLIVTCRDGMDEGTLSKTKEMLDDMHKRKIDMADGIYIINVGGYIGDSTRPEIKYAKAHGKKIQYLENPQAF